MALLGGAMALTTSCSDLDAEPSGSTMTDGQLEDVLSQDPSKLKSEVSGMYSNMIQFGAIAQWYGDTRHYDFGYASTMLMLDASGQDEPSQVSGFNWYNHLYALLTELPIVKQHISFGISATRTSRLQMMC